MHLKILSLDVITVKIVYIHPTYVTSHGVVVGELEGTKFVPAVINHHDNHHSRQNGDKNTDD